MGCLIIVGKDDDGNGTECACFYDSVTETCFGVKMNDLEEAESFREYCKVDLRTLSHQKFVELVNKFREERECKYPSECFCLDCQNDMIVKKKIANGVQM
jgi:hypothetical protein